MDLLSNIIFEQKINEKSIDKFYRRQNGIYFTYDINVIDYILEIIELKDSIFEKKILEPACGRGIIILRLIQKLLEKNYSLKLISHFIENCIYLNDIDKNNIQSTLYNIRKIYYNHFKTEYKGKINIFNEDFTHRSKLLNCSLFYKKEKINLITNHLGYFDYIISNPPYVTLYGRRDKKRNEDQRTYYLQNYRQFPQSLKNGKINYVMLFIEQAFDLLKNDGAFSYIVDMAFFETAYIYTRKFLLENMEVISIYTNLKNFDVASGQIILSCKKRIPKKHGVRIIDTKFDKTYYIGQSKWLNKACEYKFRLNQCGVTESIISRIKQKTKYTFLNKFPKKSLRTCVMLLSLEEYFTTSIKGTNKELKIYPYYRGSKSLKGKYGNFNFDTYFIYDKELQDKINDRLKIELARKGIKNKKRLGLGETIIYDNPKIYIRQSAKELIASLDLKPSSANNSLYVFSMRNDSRETIDLLYFICGWLNSELASFFSQKMQIIRFLPGKHPQIKISDLNTLPIPFDNTLREKITKLVKRLYLNNDVQEVPTLINKEFYEYFSIKKQEIAFIKNSIKGF